MAEVRLYTVTQVAMKLKVRYHRARDLMLSGQLGETKHDGRHLCITEAGLQQYLDKRRTTKGGASA